jgi:hypothetical protein
VCGLGLLAYLSLFRIFKNDGSVSFWYCALFVGLMVAAHVAMYTFSGWIYPDL